MKHIRGLIGIVLSVAFILSIVVPAGALDREQRRKEELEELQIKFDWWPTDAKPGPVKDAESGGYWWWPQEPGEVGPLWGNRGFVYVYKVIYDYKAEELPPPKPKEMRPSLLIKKIIRNVKVYFDYDKSDIRPDAEKILADAVGALNRNPEASILITGNADVRGSEQYNLKLGRKRADAVRDYMLDNGVTEERIKIVSRGKLDAVAPVTDLEGMQKDRNAQFMVAEVEEVMIPHHGKPPADAEKIDKGKYVTDVEEEVTGEVQVSTKEYVIKKDDSLWKIAERELGSGHRWKYLYEFNKDRIKDPNKLKPGKTILIPVE
jgi:outer membrane protein OmpA-like peptidoglycan-associated protein